MGFTPAGLPLSLQLVGRPFDEVTVLRAAHAYETATNWRSRRPSLEPGASFSTEPPPVLLPNPVNDPGSDGVPFAALAKREGVSPSYFTRLVRLSYLAPDITQAIL